VSVPAVDADLATLRALQALGEWRTAGGLGKVVVILAGVIVEELLFDLVVDVRPTVPRGTSFMVLEDIARAERLLSRAELERVAWARHMRNVAMHGDPKARGPHGIVRAPSGQDPVDAVRVVELLLARASGGRSLVHPRHEAAEPGRAASADLH
jgi:hypothetical protein